MTAGDIPSLKLDTLKVITPLGRGAKGVVFLVQSSDHQFLALKAICRATIENNNSHRKNSDGSEYRRICFEQEVLGLLDHPLFPKLRGVIETDKIVGYAIDYCSGGDLNTLRKNQTEKMFSPDLIRFYGAELVLALEYLHGLGIVYRDLKPENVMIQHTGHLMLIDFDLSTKLPLNSPSLNKSKSESFPTITKNNTKKKTKSIQKKRFFSYKFCNSGISPEDPVSPPVPEPDSGEKSNSFVGTEEYVAPEIILGNGHDFAVDWWCLGIVLYEMLYGTTPFRGANRKDTFHRALTQAPDLAGDPTPLRDLIRKLLEKDPKQRISLEEIKGHDFFSGVRWDMIMHIARPPYVPSDSFDEDMDGIKEIDVEAVVQGIFKVGDDTGDVSGGNNNKGEVNGNDYVVF